MRSRLFCLLLLPVMVLSAAKKTTATARGENEDLVLTVTLHIDPAEIKEWIGNDLGGHYIVVEAKVEPKYGKDIVVDRDDFVLRTDSDGEKAQPFAASQVAGSGGLVITTVTDQTGIGSPGWSGATTDVILGGAGGGFGKRPDNGGGQDKVTGRTPQDSKPNPLKKMLDSRILPEGKTNKTVSGLLYFPMEKQKMKNLELLYGGKENRISLRFKR
jgi:hypothetical protein